MSGILTALGIVISLVLSGYIIQGIMKLIGLIVKVTLIVLSFFRIRVNIRERPIEMSDEFKKTYVEIKELRQSNKNLRPKASIDWFNLGVMVTSVVLIIVNLGVVSGRVISTLLYSLVAGWGIVPSVQDMNTLFTAVIFSVLSFSTSKVIQRWKSTKQQRMERKHEKIKYKVLESMSSKEIIELAKKKDEKTKKELQ